MLPDTLVYYIWDDGVCKISGVILSYGDIFLLIFPQKDTFILVPRLGYPRESLQSLFISRG